VGDQDQNQYVKLPDGSYGSFPSSMKDEEITSAIQKNYPSQPSLTTGSGMEAAAHAQAHPKPGVLPGQPAPAPAPTVNAGTQAEPLVTPKPGESFAGTMGRGVDMGKSVTADQRDTAENEGIKKIPTVIAAASAPSMLTGLGEGITAGVPGLLKAGRGLIGSGAGGYLGGKAGADVGGFLGPTGSLVGRTIGGLGGAVIGGGLAASLGRNPTTMRIKSLPFGIQRAIPEWMVPGGVPEEEMAKGSFMNRGYKPSGSLALPGGSEDGGVLQVPEPNAPANGEKPGTMYSVKRKSVLMPAAQRGKAGALEVLRDQGKPMIVLPRGSGDYPGPRERVPLSDADDE